MGEKDGAWNYVLKLLRERGKDKRLRPAQDKKLRPKEDK